MNCNIIVEKTKILNIELVKISLDNNKYYNNIPMSEFISEYGDIDKGIMIIKGWLNEGYDIEYNDDLDMYIVTFNNHDVKIHLYPVRHWVYQEMLLREVSNLQTKIEYLSKKYVDDYKKYTLEEIVEKNPKIWEKFHNYMIQYGLLHKIKFQEFNGDIIKFLDTYQLRSLIIDNSLLKDHFLLKGLNKPEKIYNYALLTFLSVSGYNIVEGNKFAKRADINGPAMYFHGEQDMGIAFKYFRDKVDSHKYIYLDFEVSKFR